MASMPSVGVKLYSMFFKFLLKHRLQSLSHGSPETPFGVTSRPEEPSAPANPSFASDGVATKDIHIDLLTSLSVRIFLPESSLDLPRSLSDDPFRPRRSSDAGIAGIGCPPSDHGRRSSYDSPVEPGCAYGGYLPTVDTRRRSTSRRLPVMVQFHGGAFVSGSNTSAANDLFCRRIARLCDVIVIAVGYRLAPESRFPAAFEDGLKVLNWLAKQANLAECSKSLGSGKGGEGKRADGHRYIVDTFGASIVEPWLAIHGDPSRYQLFLFLFLQVF